MNSIFNIEAEKAVIGALLIDNGAVAEVLELTSPEDFSSPLYARVCREIARIVAQGAAADAIVLCRAVASENAPDDEVRGIVRHLTEVMDSAFTSAGVRTYAIQVAIAARLRRLHESCAALMVEAKEAQLVTEDDAMKFFADAHARLGEVATFGGAKTVSAAQAVAAAMRAVDDRYNLARGTMPGITTGFVWLDDLLLGLRRKRLLIVAAQAGVGKTALGLSIVANAAQAGAQTFVASYEMGVDEMMLRMLASESRVAGIKLEMGTLDAADFTRLGRGAGAIMSFPVDFADTPPATIAGLRVACQRVKRQRGKLDLVVVDYLQLVDASDKQGKNREQQVTEVSRGLKRMAMELDTCVIALSQLNRGNDRHSEPQLRDLRESGAIEQDANSVLLLWGEDDEATEIHAKLAKNRGGPVGRGKLTFKRNIQRFEEARS